jgi:hypothetical protein
MPLRMLRLILIALDHAGRRLVLKAFDPLRERIKA